MARNIRIQATAVAWTLAMALALIAAVPQAGQAQTFSLIFSFNNPGTNGIFPYAGLTMDRAGNLYGTSNGSGRGLQGQ
jgi:hypothetical protein